jgi:hypothetical protein
MGRPTDGFGSEQGRQLIELRAALNHSNHKPLTPEELNALRTAGFIEGPAKHPRITSTGRDEIRAVEEAMWDDINRECTEVGIPIRRGF